MKDVRAVGRLTVAAVLSTVPIPDPPLWDGEPLTLERLDTLNGNRRAKKVFYAWLDEANAAWRARLDKLATLLYTDGWTREPPEDWRPELLEGASPLQRKLAWLDHEVPTAEGKLDLLLRIMEASGLHEGLRSVVKGLFDEALRKA